MLKKIDTIPILILAGIGMVSNNFKLIFKGGLLYGIKGVFKLGCRWNFFKN